MDKTFLDLIVALVVEKQKESDREKLVDAGFPEAAEVI